MGDELVAGNTGDDEGVIFRPSRTEVDSVCGAQTIEWNDANLVKIRPNLAEEDLAFLKL